MSVAPQKARSRTAVCRTINASSRLTGHRHVAGIGLIANFYKGEQIYVVPCEAVKVLEEQLQLLAGQRLVVSLIAHNLTIRLTAPPTPRCELPAGRSLRSSRLINQSVRTKGDRWEPSRLLYFAAVPQDSEHWSARPIRSPTSYFSSRLIVPEAVLTLVTCFRSSFVQSDKTPRVRGHAHTRGVLLPFLQSLAGR